MKSPKTSRQTRDAQPRSLHAVVGRRVVQIAMSSTDHVVNEGAANYMLAALCNDGAIFIASATTEWRQMSPIPQPPNDQAEARQPVTSANL